ncbi:MAG: 3-dehydroquinate synthase [Smithellaceae bacterium]|nr:3-dehydroquinate synthase [Smithellaceae bacterium]
MNTIRVNLENKGSSSYNIQIGHGIVDRLGLMIKKDHPAGLYVIITDSRVKTLYGDSFVSLFKNLDMPVEMLVFPAGEESKNMAAAMSIIDSLISLKADRETMIIALGGGVVGDLAGFVASIYLRGIPFLQAPTTLLAQVDSSIGGKTGVDLTAGKNLVGAIYQPRGVFIDTKFLLSLPEREWKNGLAEIVKYGLIEGGEYLALLEENLPALKTRQPELLHGVIEGACRIKAGFVEIDEQDRGVRRFLNLGHTLGHALEAESGYNMSHGEAVAIGIAAALELSRRHCHLPAEDAKRALTLMDELGVPRTIPGNADTGALMEHLKRDKKRQGQRINFVLLKRLGMPFVTGGVSEQLLSETIEELKG